MTRTAKGASARPAAAPNSWAGILPSLFVLLSLVALLAGPLVMQSRIRGLSDQIQDAADPARTGATRIQYLLARQTSALRGYLISGEPEYLDQFRRLAAEEEAVYEVLDSLTRRLGPDVVTGLAELRTMSLFWHQDLAEELRLIDGEFATSGEIPFERDAYLAAIDAAARFDGALAFAIRERQRGIRAAEDRMLIVQAGLVAIALIAAFITARLGANVRRSAADAEAGRQEAERALTDSAKAIQAKARLIRGVTHDVKNPLGAADGYAELLEMGLRGPLTPEQTQMVAGIRRSIHGGLSIINDLLELAGAEGGSLAVHPSIFSLPKLVNDCIEEYRGAADAARHQLEIDVRNADIIVRNDPSRITQILGNLLSNAIKYTPAGGTVRVDLDLVQSDSPAPLAVVRVIDSGPGIPREYHERIFEEFERLPGAEAGAQGHGLGLAIARRIARLIGGDLWVESDGVSGSAFSLRIPALDEHSDSSGS
jgi:signal transduction histidine kinase